MATSPREEARSEPPLRAQLASPLDVVNDGFHEVYGQARDEAQRDGPVFVLLADTLVVFQRGERRALSFTPRAFHVIKSVAHAPIAIYAALHRGFARGEAQGAVAALAAAVEASFSALEAEELEPALREELRSLLRACLHYLERTQTGTATTPEDLEAFARTLGPSLSALLDTATRMQLTALDEHVATALAGMDTHEREALQVVVTGDHQARQRSLPMQYFRKRLREPEGSEERVTYAEGVTDEQQALALVGTRRLDRALARAFFGDPKRLQRDLLGDSAQRLLSAVDLPAIV